ncbi:DUF1800 domain-containing protein [Nocardioides sp. YIM 152588]|uniref:DUF1800 domain-containing protein n=1 Tax=Nocardioides sp. YIM 152588 TaxID=3158259 RepID=UPI0032E4C852
MKVRRYRRTAVPTRAELHMMNRFSAGFSTATWKQMQRAGSPAAWFEQQLRPGGIRESAKAKAVLDWYPRLADSPERKWANHTSGKKKLWTYPRDMENLSILRRVHTRRQVREVMVDFWANHLHVSSGNDWASVARWHYEETLRKHALGRFTDLLAAATLHPAMLIYLDNYRTTRDNPNENHGRELLELHTVGTGTGFTEQMVKDSATILSGWTVDAQATWQRLYDPGRHTTGRVSVLGFTDPNAAADGRDLTHRYLDFLARHPATARTIARRLAVRFVDDEPGEPLIAHLADTYLANDTSIAAVLRALVQRPEFKRAFRTKVRTPVEDLVATLRVLRVAARPPGGDEQAFANTIGWSHGGAALYSWPRPDGAPETNDAYAGASRLMASFQSHWGLAGGWWPKKAVRYRAPKSFFPKDTIRADLLVDHLCRVLHGSVATPTLLAAALEATDLSPGEKVTRSGPVGSWLGVRLIGALLDTPEHMTR